MLISDSTGADSGTASVPACDSKLKKQDALGLDQFEMALGQDHALTVRQVRQLFELCAGQSDLARVVAELSRVRDIPQDLSDSSFLDYIAPLILEPELGVNGSDRCVAAVLSHLQKFSRATAMQVIAALPDDSRGTSILDGENVLMRLRMMGTVVEDEPGLYRIPALLAAVLRHRFNQLPNSEETALGLVEILFDLVKHTPSIDPLILSDVLPLARRAGSWSTLAKLQEFFGLSMFLLVPESICSAYAGLPAEALTAEPDLEFFSQVAAFLVDSVGDSFEQGQVRTALAHITRPGQLNDRFPGPGAIAELGVGSGHVLGSRSSLKAGCTTSGVSGEHSAIGVTPDYIEVLGMMVRCASAGHFEEAASVGLEWSTKSDGRRALLVIRFFTAAALFHAGNDRRALSILHGIEEAVAEDHIAGDFLFPAVLAWSALIGATGGDSVTADDYLNRLDDGDWFPLMLDELVRPPMSIARALRALDRLDLGTARTEYASLVEYPEVRSLWVYLPVVGRMAAILSASSESGLLFVNDAVEQQRGELSLSAAGGDLICSSRALLFIGLGQLRWAELEMEKMRTHSGERVVLMVRIELAAGRFQNAIALVDTWFYHQSLTPTQRSELAAIKAAALLQMARVDEAFVEFNTAIELCAWVGTLLPLALLPRNDRESLIALTTNSAAWDEIATVLSGHYLSREDLLKRLLTVGAASVNHFSFPQLSTAEAQLLEYLSTGLSIAQIAVELHQVVGTVKNRLSALYRKFGVSSKGELVTRARSLGFILPT